MTKLAAPNNSETIAKLTKVNLELKNRTVDYEKIIKSVKYLNQKIPNF
jgi:hypothetical protein